MLANRFVSIIVILICSTFHALHAEVLILEDGSTVDGTVIREDAVSVTIRSGDEVVKIAKEDVREFLYEFATEQERQAAIARLKTSREELDAQMLRIMTRSELEAFITEERRRIDAGMQPAGTDSVESDRPVAEELEGLVWRSALLPGQGQLYAGRDVAGRAFAIGMLGIGTVFFATHRDVVRMNAEYAAANLRTRTASIYSAWIASPLPAALAYADEERIFHRRIEASRDRQAVSILFLGIYVWNLVDAGLTSSGAAPEADVGWNFDVRRQEIQSFASERTAETRTTVAFYWKF